jgi:hypothetical protein
MSLFALVMSAVAAEQNECRFAAIKLPNWVLTFEAESQKCTIWEMPIHGTTGENMSTPPKVLPCGHLD